MCDQFSRTVASFSQDAYANERDGRAREVGDAKQRIANAMEELKRKNELKRYGYWLKSDRSLSLFLLMKNMQNIFSNIILIYHKFVKNLLSLRRIL